jgi:hypothetical protein
VSEQDTFERRRLRVYVAGPISKGDVFDNIVRAIKWGRRMVHDGLAPYIPHFDAFMFAWGDGTGLNTEEIGWNSYLEWDLEWVAVSDAVFRVAGESKGADLECRIAEQLGIPIFYEDNGPLLYDDLLLYAEMSSLSGVRK